MDISKPILGAAQSGKLMVGNPNAFVYLQRKLPIDNYTIQFNIAPPIDVTTSARAAARARIEWSVLGNSVVRLVSVSDGTSITGTAEAVSVKLFDATTPGFVFAVPEYAGSIQVARGTRGANKQPPYLALEPRIVVAGNQGTLNIPADVGANSVFVVANVVATVAVGTVIPPAAITVVQQGGVGVATVWDPRDHDWVPLDPGALRLLFNVNASVPSSVRFTTYLGIDG